MVIVLTEVFHGFLKHLQLNARVLSADNCEVCHPRCVFKLYGEVNSDKNTTINIWLNDGVYWQWKKLHVSAYSGHIQVLTTFLLKELYIVCLNSVVMLRYHHQFTCIC